ncbi:MAG: LysR substrate-binding domain-containing protein, partial [Pseudomonas sagittaria]|nr:LysR substrate-binding domain-containing protein [Pseudomonas sagittaria]
LGLCQMPLYLFRQHLTDGRLVEVLAELEPDPVDIYALWPKTSHLRPKVRYVVDQLIEFSQHW